MDRDGPPHSTASGERPFWETPLYSQNKRPHMRRLLRRFYACVIRLAARLLITAFKAGLSGQVPEVLFVLRSRSCRSWRKSCPGVEWAEHSRSELIMWLAEEML